MSFCPQGLKQKENSTLVAGKFITDLSRSVPFKTLPVKAQ
jgi:hypothetical protein